jgi:hypothetical protein
MLLVMALAAMGCGGEQVEVGTTTEAYSGGSGNGNNVAGLSPSQLLGREVWLKATFGGQAMFSVLLPSLPAPNTLLMAFDKVLTTPRAQRFAQWGTINDPDCTDGDASTFGLDRCPPEQYPPIPGLTPDQVAGIMGNKSGVVGVRTFPNPFFGNPQALPPGISPVVAAEPVLVGVACAGCHAGWDPENPPASTASPTWANIHLTAGNQYLQTGKIFAGHLPESDPKWQVFHSWKAGTVDTTAIESDHINNPGIISQFWNVPDRPFFNLHYNNVSVYDPPSALLPSIVVHRGGQGGEDDTGCQMAALRVYFNIGMCAQECMLPHLNNGPGGGQTPIDLAACAQTCAAYPAAAQLVNPMCDFMTTPTSPQLPASYVNPGLARRGAMVFQTACASCHSNGKSPDTILSDDQLHPAKGALANEFAGEIGTNSCRAKTTNWQAGQIWAAFSSEEQRARGPGNYRDFPLAGVWATAPFFHNNQLGPQPNMDDPGVMTVATRVAMFEQSMDQLLNPWKRTPVIETTTTSISVPTPIAGVSLPVPAGTPVGAFANLNPNNPLQNFCPDFVENEGHYFGTLLPPGDKAALTEYLKTK